MPTVTPFDDRGDPYLAWSAANRFAGHAAVRPDGTSAIPVLLQVGPGQWASLMASGKVRVPGVYGPGDKYITCTTLERDLPALAALVDRLELALPLNAGEVDATPASPAQSSAPLVFAVIDRGCAFLHQNFRSPSNAAQTRLIGVWDQGTAATVSPWAAPSGFGYGRELGAAAINRLIVRMAQDFSSEDSLYRELDYLLDGGGRVRSFAHGTHVLDVGAGRLADQRSRLTAKPAFNDPASFLPLIFVDVPALSARDSAGASSAAFLIDALRYIRLRAGAQARVIVNISLGALAGPHDGTSLVEKAIDEQLSRDQRMAVTMAAGNAGQAEVDRWHACGALSGQDSGAALHWRVRADDPTDSFVELWFKPPAGGQSQAWVQLTSPQGETTGWVPVGGAHALLPGPIADRPAAAIYTRAVGEQGTDAMALVALAPCAGPRRAAAAGLWQIEINTAAGSPALFDAWIQRDDPVWNGTTPVQSFFESVAGSARVTGDGSLSSLATGTKTIVVGAADALTESVTPYTSRGVAGSAKRRRVPDIDAFAVADESATAIGLLAAGVRSGTWVRMGGTSVAAPRAARTLLNHVVGAKSSGTSLSGDIQTRLPRPPPVRL